MTGRKVRHETIVLERMYAASPGRVFQAWADPAARAKWDVPDDDWEVTEHVQEFRVGGREASRFGPKGGPTYYSEGRFLDIVENRRIVSAGVMHEGETPMTATLCTIELVPEMEGTRVVLTDQSAFWGGEKPEHRRDGWGTILDRLGAHLAGVSE